MSTHPVIYAFFACSAVIPIGVVVGSADPVTVRPISTEARDQVEVGPAQRLRRCQTATLVAPEDDDLAYEWVMEHAPESARFTVTATGQSAVTVFPTTPGDYTVRLTTEDPVGIRASRAFPLRARGCDEG